LSRGVYIPLSGALIQEKNLSVVANNLANVNTAGFKGDRLMFRAVLTDAVESSANIPSMRLISQNPISSSIYNMNRTLLTGSGTKTDFSPGHLRETGNPLNLALVGDGFFSIRTPDGLMYTRDGSFTLNSEGELVTRKGFPVLGQSGVISMPEGKDVFINADGIVSVDGNEVDRLKVIDFPRPYPLRKRGHSLFALATSQYAEKIATDVKVQQGFLEQSNVNVVREMVSMIEINRAYEAYQKVIQTALDVVDRKAVNEIGRLA